MKKKKSVQEKKIKKKSINNENNTRKKCIDRMDIHTHAIITIYLFIIHIFFSLFDLSANKTSFKGRRIIHKSYIAQRTNVYFNCGAKEKKKRITNE